MCGKAGRICPGDGDYKLQREIRASGRASLYDEDRHIHGDADCFRGSRMSAVKVSGHDKCRSEAETTGILCEDSGDGSRMGDAQCGEADEGVERHS